MPSEASQPSQWLVCADIKVKFGKINILQLCKQQNEDWSLSTGILYLKSFARNQLTQASEGCIYVLHVVLWPQVRQKLLKF